MTFATVGCCVFEIEIVANVKMSLWICVAHQSIGTPPPLPESAQCGCSDVVVRNVFNTRRKAASVTLGLRTGCGRLLHAVGLTLAKPGVGHKCWVGAMVSGAACDGPWNTDDRVLYIVGYIQDGPKKLAHFVLYALTSSNIDRFSNLFHYLNQENICNNIANKDPTTLQVCRYTIPCEMSVS